MSFQTDAGALGLAAAWSAETAVKATLSALVGTYGLVKQFDLNQRQIVIAEAANARAQEFLAITQDAYNVITKPIVALDRTLFERFVSSFANYQALYETEAFRFTVFDADYVMQEGRALSTVQRQFDKAALQRSRQRGKYNTGRAVYESVWFATMTALAKVDAANHSYRFEEARKRYYDSWYFKRQTDGVHVVEQMEAHAISALNHGASSAAQGLHSIGGAEAGLLKAAENSEATLANRADIWGSVANGAFKFAGYSLSERGMGGMGMNQSMYGGWNEPANDFPSTGLPGPPFGSLVPNT